MMTYALYLDDERDPKTDKDWLIVRSYDEFVVTIKERGLPSQMSLDHDLGDESKSGYECAKWLVDHCLDEGLSLTDVDFWSHSANPVGRDNIMGILEGFQRHQQEEST